VEANRRSWKEYVRYDEAARFYSKTKGQWVWVRTISTPVFDPQGKLTHFTGLVLDITEQKQAEAELRYRAAFENLILSLATRFINLPPEEIDDAICVALQHWRIYRRRSQLPLRLRRGSAIDDLYA
jgi:hypothetical protein